MQKGKAPFRRTKTLKEIPLESSILIRDKSSPKKSRDLYIWEGKQQTISKESRRLQINDHILP